MAFEDEGLDRLVESRRRSGTAGWVSHTTVKRRLAVVEMATTDCKSSRKISRKSYRRLPRVNR